MAKKAVAKKGKKLPPWLAKKGEEAEEVPAKGKKPPVKKVPAKKGKKPPVKKGK